MELSLRSNEEWRRELRDTKDKEGSSFDVLAYILSPILRGSFDFWSEYMHTFGGKISNGVLDGKMGTVYACAHFGVGVKSLPRIPAMIMRLKESSEGEEDM